MVGPLDYQTTMKCPAASCLKDLTGSETLMTYCCYGNSSQPTIFRCVRQIYTHKKKLNTDIVCDDDDGDDAGIAEIRRTGP